MDQKKGNEPYVEHKVTDGYRDYYRREWKGDHTLTPSAPFGTHRDYDPNDLDSKTGKQEKVELPIQGPPNWNQIWTNWQSIGTDYKTPDKIIQYLEDKSKNRLKFHNLISSGSYGEVYRVTGTKSNGRKVSLAAKVIKLVNDPQYPTSFVEEVKVMLEDMLALRYIKHQNIVTIFEFMGMPDEETGFPYASVALFMEFMRWRSQIYLDNNPPQYSMCKKHCMKWFREIADALQYLHHKNISHLDIKPQNILYKYVKTRPTGKFDISHVNQMIFKLCDFGLSIAYNPEDAPFLTNEYRGTPAFMAKEMKDKMDYDLVETKPCDIFSLGVTLAYTFIGKQCDLDILPNLIDMAYTYNAGPYNQFNKPMIELIASMIKKDPKTRLTIEEVIKKSQRL